MELEWRLSAVIQFTTFAICNNRETAQIKSITCLGYFAVNNKWFETCRHYTVVCAHTNHK